MLLFRKFVCLLSLFIVCSSNAFSVTTLASDLGIKANSTFYVNKPIDLKGDSLQLPQGVTLCFTSGYFKNGIIVGNKTKMTCSGIAFDHMTIKGSWNVPDISTKMFADLSYENALKDVLALANPKVKNVITIEKGDYKVKANKSKDACLTLSGNTDLILNGNVRMIPNNYPAYDIIKVSGHNISIRGNGMIVGDKQTHLGHGGEWGMGIRIDGVVNVSVSGLTVKDCWGDCIYIGGNSKNVLIEKCMLDHGRRQGISVTKADGVTIRNCKISNVSGTNPQFAIDLEPNPNDTVDHVLIENVEVVDCEGGILVTTGRKNAEKKRIGKVEIRNCKVSALSHYSIGAGGCESLLVEHCIINAKNVKSAIYSKESRSVVVRNNIIYVEKELVSSVKNAVKGFVGKKGFVPIHIVKAGKQDVRDNKIVER
jgi:hypothetical protein